MRHGHNPRMNDGRSPAIRVTLMPKDTNVHGTIFGGVLLSYIDLIDSRMEIYAETLPSVPAGGFSQRIFALEKKIYHHN